jgi:hypothetical protein
MFLTLSAICVAALCLLIASQIKRARDQSEMEQHSITPEALHQSCSLPAQNRLQLRDELQILATRVLPRFSYTGSRFTTIMHRRMR